MFKIITFFILIFSTTQIFSTQNDLLDQPQQEMSDEERESAFWALNWQRGGTYKLFNSNSTLSLPESYLIVTGEEAKKARSLISGEVDNTYLEAVVYDQTFENRIIFETVKDGYVISDDWMDVDPKIILTNIKESHEKANIERRELEGGEKHIIGWIQEPTFNKQSNTVSWSTEAKYGDEETINAFAVKFGREGYVQISILSPKILGSEHLDIMLQSFKFDSGFDYENYKIGDQLANYSIADLFKKNESNEDVLAFWALNWKTTGSHKLPESNSTLSIPTGYKLLIGEEARTARSLSSDDLADPNLEAIAFDETINHTILIENVKIGYVSLDDWEELDVKGLLDSVIENTNISNVERRKKGFNALQVIGWVNEPTLNREKNTIYWSIELQSEGRENIINSIALKLGRNGYERFNWITTKNLYDASNNHLETILKSFSFDPGFQYSDYTLTDELAEYGIASVVAATIGGKLIQATGALFFLKKFAGALLVAISTLLYKLKQCITRKKSAKP